MSNVMLPVDFAIGRHTRWRFQLQNMRIARNASHEPKGLISAHFLLYRAEVVRTVLDGMQSGIARATGRYAAHHEKWLGQLPSKCWRRHLRGVRFPGASNTLVPKVWLKDRVFNVVIVGIWFLYYDIEKIRGSSWICMLKPMIFFLWPHLFARV